MPLSIAISVKNTFAETENGRRMQIGKKGNMERANEEHVAEWR